MTAPDSTPTPPVSGDLLAFLDWLQAKDYKLCRVSWGERKLVDESDKQLVAEFMQTRPD